MFMLTNICMIVFTGLRKSTSEIEVKWYFSLFLLTFLWKH